MTLEKTIVQWLKHDTIKAVEVDTANGEACPVELINNANDNSLCTHTGGNYRLFSCILFCSPLYGYCPYSKIYEQVKEFHKVS